MIARTVTAFLVASCVCAQAQKRVDLDIAQTSRENGRAHAVSGLSALAADSIRNIAAIYRAGQVFVTWDNLAVTGIRYTLYRSAAPIQYGHQLTSAVNLGQVRDNSGYNQRLSEVTSSSLYLKTDSAALPLSINRGLFVATSTDAGSYFYAVTSTSAAGEDTTIVPGANATTTPVIESVAMPDPVWQTRWTLFGRNFDIYALYCTKVVSAVFPVLVNAGSYPMHFAVSKASGVSPAPTVVLLHPDDSHLLDASKLGFWNPDPGECIVTIDDWLPDQLGVTTCFYGYHENYNIYSNANPVPTSGMLYDYTFARVKYTTDWVVRHLPADSTRMSVAGLSAGGIGALFTAIMLPARFASAVAIDTQCDMASAFFVPDNMHWGTPQSNLPTNDGLHRNTRLKAGYLASMYRSRAMPILFTFCGKNDQVVGWREKIPFYDSLNRTQHGGYHFWDQTNHSWNASPWKAGFGSFSFVHRYRTDRSYPAYSNSSLNGDPGNGDPSSGQAVGTINGLLDWSDQIIDTTDRWEDTLRTRSIVNAFGTVAAPDSGLVDVTLRRLQMFDVPVNSLVAWENWKDGAVCQKDSFLYSGGLITIPRVRVFKGGNRLVVRWKWGAVDGVVENQALPLLYELGDNYPNPFNPSTTIEFSVPNSGQTTLKVYDLLGREVATLVNEVKSPGRYSALFDGAGLASGTYFYRLQAGGFAQTKRLMLLK